ncbi:nitroreductase family deazaflavin-dependent oxidoreductase [Kutzneria chonburiensis]|uniref:Nitroreductase family deazaflavin-dependent oxidoreductase n=1 Tax=Kutzneria chonburiensis TaxID=1483604 RepID=A0ABV6MS71_9PSEU|nr:nitroreductase family deazaflavin-dependent oxidoreductase [Kutzneria chonburiensis]
MPLQGEYEASAQDWVREQVEKFEASGGTEATELQGVPIIVVTSVGAKSGKLRKSPVMRVEHDGSYAAVASYGGAPKHPVWYHNFKANPLVEVQDKTVKKDYRARELAGEERQQWWDRAIQVWPAYVDYTKKTDRLIPVFVLEPVN